MTSLLALLGVVLPSMVISVVVHRKLEKLDFRVVALFIVLSVTFVGGGLMPGRITVPVDEASRGWPFRGVVGDVVAKNPLTNDTSKLFLPWMQTVREELANGNLPLWNRYLFSGYPLLGNGESAPFSPIFLTTLFVPLPKQIVAMAGLKIFVALLFTFLYARRLGANRSGAIASAAAFTFASANVVYLYYSAAAATLLLPIVIYACSRLAESMSRTNVILTTAAMFSLLGAGHPESAFHAAIVTAIGIVIELAASGRSLHAMIRPLARVASVTMIASLASAIQWLPVLWLIPESVRYAEIVETGRRMTESMPAIAAWTLIHPDAFGNPARGNWSWLYNYSIVASSYFGLLALGFTMAAVVDRRERTITRAFGICSVVLYLVAMNWTIVGSVLNAIPPFGLAANDKLRFAVAFFVAIAAGLRISYEQRTRWLDGTILLALGAIAIYLRADKGTITSPLIFTVAAAAILIGSWSLATPSRRFAAGAATFIVADLFVLGFSFHAAVGERYFRPQLPIVEAIRSRAPEEPFRIAGFGWSFIPNTAAQYGLEDIRGSDPMSLASYDRYLARFARRESGADLRRIDDAERAELDFLNVKFLVAAPGENLSSDRWRKIYSGIDGSLYENRRFKPRFFVPHRLWPAGAVTTELDRLEDHGTDVVVEGVERTTAVPAPRGLWISQRRAGRFRLSIDAPQPTFVASSVPYTEGWRVVIGDRPAPLRIVNGAFIGFEVPAGRSSVLVSYRPRSVRYSLLLLPAGVIALAMILRRSRAATR